MTLGPGIACQWENCHAFRGPEGASCWGLTLCRAPNLKIPLKSELMCDPLAWVSPHCAATELPVRRALVKKVNLTASYTQVSHARQEYSPDGMCDVGFLCCANSVDGVKDGCRTVANGAASILGVSLREGKVKLVAMALVSIGGKSTW